MVSKKRVLEKTKHPKIELIEQKERIVNEHKKLKKVLIWIMIILIISLIIEISILLLK